MLPVVLTALAGRAAAGTGALVAMVVVPPLPARPYTAAPPAPDASATATRSAGVRREVIGGRFSWGFTFDGCGVITWNRHPLKGTSAANEGRVSPARAVRHDACPSPQPPGYAQ